MEKEFVPYELALELKELGMDLGWYNYLNFYDSSTKEFCFVMKDIPAPLYQQTFRWFREKYNMNHSIIFHETTFSNDYQYLILSNDNEFVEVGYATYEEAELACLKKLIEIVKTK
jgi:regulatory protein YycH of two-component signal transduction system YycFG